MNTQTYRPVFNTARACVVAVAETARGCGKGGQAGGMRIKRRRGSSARRCKPKWPLAPVASNYFAIDSGVFAYATNTLTVKSGGNTNLVGAQLAGNTVKMGVGRDLNVVTLQDKSDFASEQHSSGFGISLCLPPLCAGGAPVTGSINKNDASINHNYQSAGHGAIGQSGIAAGSGGYDITVKGNTHLAGGAITSTAPQDQNTIKTASLTSSDVNNSQSTSSQSTSLSVGYSGGSGTSTLLTNARTNALANLGAGGGMPANGSQSGTTQSVISPGNVTITGTGNATTDANSNTQVANLTNRDASTANGALTNTLTLQQAQQIPSDQQKAAENAQIAQLVAPVVFNVVGDIAQQNGWAESSPQKIALHAVAGYVVATVSGGNGGQGAVAAAANEATTSTISSIVDKAMPIPAGATPAEVRQIELDRNVVKETASTLVGAGTVAIAGGTNQQIATGGNIALAADQNNRQLHPTEAKLIKDNAVRYARLLYGVDQPTAEQVQSAAYRLTNTAQGALDNNISANVPSFTSAENFLATLKIEYFQQNGNMILPGTSSTQTLFYATNEQRNQPWLNQGLADPTITGLISTKPNASSLVPSVSQFRPAPGWNYMGNSSAGLSSGVTTDNRTLNQIDASLSQTTTFIALAPTAAVAATYSPIGFTAGVVGDAAGQAVVSYVNTGTVTIRPTQSLFSGVTGSAALVSTALLPALTFSAPGAINLAGNTVAGGTTAIINTQFNNWLYGEIPSLWQAGGLGLIGGGSAPVFGVLTQDFATGFLANVPRIPMSGPVKPIAAQGPLNPLPAQIGAGVNLGFGASPAFVDPTWIFTPAKPLPTVPTPPAKPASVGKP